MVFLTLLLLLFSWKQNICIHGTHRVHELKLKTKTTISVSILNHQDPIQRPYPCLNFSHSIFHELLETPCTYRIDTSVWILLPDLQACALPILLHSHCNFNCSRRAMTKQMTHLCCWRNSLWLRGTQIVPCTFHPHDQVTLPRLSGDILIYWTG